MCVWTQIGVPYYLRNCSIFTSKFGRGIEVHNDSATSCQEHLSRGESPHKLPEWDSQHHHVLDQTPGLWHRPAGREGGRGDSLT